MKHFYLSIVLLFVAIFSFSQGIENNPEFKAQIDYMFQHLEKTRVPHGLLKDYALELAKMEDYAGQLSDTNQVYVQNYLDIMRTLFSAQINTSVIDSVDILQKQIEDYTTNNEIILSGLTYEYAYIRQDALTGGFITYQNEQVFDKYTNGVWQNPYLTKRVIAFSPIDTVYEGLNQTFRLPVSFYKTNLSGNTIQFDAGDGLGFRNMPPDNSIQVNYATTGYKTLTFKVSVNGTQLLSHSKILIKDMPFMPMSINIHNTDTLFISSNELFEGKRAYGYMTIFYANPDKIIRKPLIVAEGFDPGHILSPSSKHGENDVRDFINSIENDANSLYQYFSNNDYDIIYIDWINGTDDIRRNAKLLKTAINMVNQRKASSSVKNVIIGQSMGGLVTRWALKEMENEGTDHQCNI